MRDRHSSRVSAGSSASGPCSCQPATSRRTPRAARTACPSAWRRGSASRHPRRPAAASRPLRPASRACCRVRAAGGASCGAECQHRSGVRQRLRARRGEPQPAGQHRVEQHPVALELKTEELAAPPDLDQPLADEPVESAGVPRTTSVCGVAHAAKTGRTGPCRERRRGSPGQAAQARRPIVDAELSVVTFAGPAGSSKKSACVPT